LKWFALFVNGIVDVTGQSMLAFLCIDRSPLSIVPGVNLCVECRLQCAVNDVTLGSKLIFLLGTKDQVYALKT